MQIKIKIDRERSPRGLTRMCWLWQLFRVVSGAGGAIAGRREAASIRGDNGSRNASDVRVQMYVSMPYTGFARRNTLFVFLRLCHRNARILIQHVGCYVCVCVVCVSDQR